VNIVKRELKANLKSFIIWAVALSVIFLTASTEFEAYYNNDEIMEAMKTFEQLFMALGVRVEDMTTPKGFLVLVSIYIYLPLSIYAGLLGSGIIAKEEKDKTAEFLFTMPASRARVITAKLFVAIVYIILLDLVAIGINIIAYSRFALSSDFYQFTLYLWIGVFFTELIFLSIGLFLSSVLNQHKLSGSLTIGILISTFMISMLIGFVEEAQFLKYITPFQYFPAEKMVNTSFEFIFLLMTVMIVIPAIYGLYYFYQKRDLTI